jgi:hypothetical protein
MRVVDLVNEHIPRCWVKVSSAEWGEDSFQPLSQTTFSSCLTSCMHLVTIPFHEIKRGKNRLNPDLIGLHCHQSLCLYSEWMLNRVCTVYISCQQQGEGISFISLT